MQLPASQLHIGDLIRFTANGLIYRVTARNSRLAVPGLMEITVSGLDPMTMPKSSPVFGTSLPRHVSVPCLLCTEDQPTVHNLVDGPPPRACVCATCNTRVNRAVFAPGN